MKKVLVLTFILTIILIGAYLVFGIVSKVKEKDKHRIGKDLNEFTFITLDGYRFTKNDIWPNKFLVFKYFSPECFYCINETKEILNNIDQLRESQILMISPSENKLVSLFIDSMDLKVHNEIIVLLDDNYEFEKVFGISNIPSTVVFDENQKLIESIKGEVPIDYIIKLISGTDDK